MSRPLKGSVLWRCDKKGVWGWHARISLADGYRPLVQLDPNIPEHDRDAALQCAFDMTTQLRANGVTRLTLGKEKISKGATAEDLIREVNAILSSFGGHPDFAVEKVLQRRSRNISPDSIRRLLFAGLTKLVEENR